MERNSKSEKRKTVKKNVFLKQREERISRHCPHQNLQRGKFVRTEKCPLGLRTSPPQACLIGQCQWR